jgi:neuralized-like protein 4
LHARLFFHPNFSELSTLKFPYFLETLPPVNTNTRDAQPVAEGTDNQTAARRVGKFGETHGRLIVLNDDRTGATRLNALTEFNHAVVISEQPLEDDHLFEVVIEQITDRFVFIYYRHLPLLPPPGRYVCMYVCMYLFSGFMSCRFHELQASRVAGFTSCRLHELQASVGRLIGQSVCQSPLIKS